MKTHGPLNIDGFVEPQFQENGYLLWPTDNPHAWIVDPGLPPQTTQIADAIQKHGLTASAILITHCHGDHIAGATELCETFPDLELYAPHAEEHMLTDTIANLSAPFGFHVVTPPAEKLLAPGDEMTLGSLTFRILDVSGHSPGGLAYYCPDAGIVLTGDALFAGSIGRTDFPGGSARQLLDNIRRNLLTLPEETLVYSGHGPPTTIAIERDSNPYLREGFLE